MPSVSGPWGWPASAGLPTPLRTIPLPHWPPPLLSCRERTPPVGRRAPAPFRGSPAVGVPEPLQAPESPDPYPSLACRVLTTQTCIRLPLTLYLPPTSSFAPTDLMYEQTKALMEGKSVMKPIYNHVSGLLDPAEKIDAPKILVRVPF